MDRKFCQAKTKSGQQCKLPAGESGYCHIHDPSKIEKRKSSRDEATKLAQTKGRQLEEIIDVIIDTARAKGWFARVSNMDRTDWQFATVDVSRSYYTSLGRAESSGFFEITMGDGVRVVRQGTSFNHYGLRDLHDAIMANIDKLTWIAPKKKEQNDKAKSNLTKLINLLQRFHIISRQLQHRYNNRETIIIQDEYDIQDLLHALLKTQFDDIRPEEYSPSYGGATSRMDFLLKREKIVIEVKMASNKLKDKLIGEQLIVDIQRYQSHPDCKTLVCFIYDPRGWIRYPQALENDLSKIHNGLNVVVLVLPK
jgi:hypothetical protein